MTPDLARWIVRDPLYWPRCLSDAELQEEYTRISESDTHQPVSLRMLRAEIARRKEQPR